MKFSLINRHGNAVYDKSVMPILFTPTKFNVKDSGRPEREPYEEYKVEVIAATDQGHKITLTIDYIDEDTVRAIQNYFVEEFSDGGQ